MTARPSPANRSTAVLQPGWRVCYGGCEGPLYDKFKIFVKALVATSRSLISVLGKTEQSAGGIGWAFLLIMSMTAGGMIPLMVMPPWMQTVSNISPVKWLILGMEGAIWRQFSISEMALPCGILLGVGVLFFALGVKIFDFTYQE